jgi:tRNA-specific 2-thiouridylase
VSEYVAGRTPNPCIQCNNWLKFGELMRRAAALDCAYVATDSTSTM